MLELLLKEKILEWLLKFATGDLPFTVNLSKYAHDSSNANEGTESMNVCFQPVRDEFHTVIGVIGGSYVVHGCVTDRLFFKQWSSYLGVGILMNHLAIDWQTAGL